MRGRLISAPTAHRAGNAVGSDAHIAPVIAAGDDAAARRRQEASGDASLQETDTVGAGVPDRPPEADSSETDAKMKKCVARLEGLRRWMLVIAPILMLGGYFTDRLPILYASAIPLAVALLVTYRIKHLEEAAGKEELKSKK